MKKICLLIFMVGTLSAQNSILKQFSDQFADIAEKANPTVVTILTEKKVDLSRLHGQLPQDNDFFKFFAPRMPRQREYKSTALGSGVIVNSRKGYVITNNHVVDDMDEITVRLLDKTEYKATVVGRDPKSDLAVLQIDARGLTDLDFGNSDKLRVGEWVIAVGSPFSANLSHTVTAGIVSAKGRGNIIQGDVYEDFIQTDAAINPGNSGGALLNSAGDLIGINTAIYTNSFDRSNKGVGFAIPSNMVKRVMADLIEHGKVLRSWIGVQIQPLDNASASAMGLKSPDGALVSDVVKDGPAKKAGLKTGDVIIEFNHVQVKNVDHLRNTVSASKPNKRYDLIVIRDSRKKTLKVTLEEMPGDDALATVSRPPAQTNELGIQVSSLSQSVIREYDISKGEEGVIVIAVVEGSIAAEAGIRIGDLITRVGTKKCNSPRGFAALIKETQKKNMIMLHMKRDGVARYMTLELDD
ncbi:MAG: Do family serine endopeptidase [Candidatus Marinimicrobia bacterium]|jgi:serine protease Do|nr:Do family serine endopeptidase [Candidatus Neomarinimicrobiota bacterium]MBT3947150.1 Do family serine endopeptidase [Candidatus Neomarinimicrobiota bacterium]MBT4063702.1 Do family serine endopeptidase [Candidatus Neomarinimicrobiota bacterium]MBT4307438.1 Do family serine endopeptidase [Candidatus Neomarinimicrobiota bacterium]MBT4453254.1 Do family serine endopeptidase [Candidatus Neomarinimicrobiota bacterium]